MVGYLECLLDFICFKAPYADKDVSFALRGDCFNSLDIGLKEATRCASYFFTSTAFLLCHTSAGYGFTRDWLFTAN
jgi:hypothetical protein